MSSDVAQPTIFLSYAHGDQAQAQRLAAALQRGGYTVWWDALIEGGTRYAASIDEALETADAVVVLWSASRSIPTGCATRRRRDANGTGWCRCRSTGPTRLWASGKSR